MTQKIDKDIPRTSEAIKATQVHEINLRYRVLENQMEEEKVSFNVMNICMAVCQLAMWQLSKARLFSSCTATDESQGKLFRPNNIEVRNEKNEKKVKNIDSIFAMYFEV